MPLLNVKSVRDLNAGSSILQPNDADTTMKIDGAAAQETGGGNAADSDRARGLDARMQGAGR